jgi:hypothetical protein
MNDLVIDACRWHVDAEAPAYKQRAFEHFRDRYTILLEFLRANGLLRHAALSQNIEWPAFELRQSHLTEEGFALVKLCHETWNPAFGQGHTQRHLVQWQHKLSKMRASA